MKGIIEDLARPYQIEERKRSCGRGFDDRVGVTESQADILDFPQNCGIIIVYTEIVALCGSKNGGSKRDNSDMGQQLSCSNTEDCFQGSRNRSEHNY